MNDNWQFKCLEEICSFENGDRGENYPSKSVQTTSGVPFINAGHLSPSGIDFREMNYIPRERFNLLGNGKIREGDILFCLRGSLGKFASVGELAEGAIASSLVIVRPNKSVLEKFLLAYFDSSLCAGMIAKYSNGAAQPNLSAGSLKKFTMPLPPIEEQQRIAAILDEAFAGIVTATANAEKNLANTRELFESILQDIYTQKKNNWVEKKLADLCDIKHGFAFDGKDFDICTDTNKPIVLTPGNFIEYGTLSFTDKNTKRYSGNKPMNRPVFLGGLLL
jgi:type I restriction enzyme, S subunit